MLSQHAKYSIAVAFAALLITYGYGRIDYRNPAYSTWELHDYREMAQAVPNLTETVRQPFVYRILGPYLVGLIPLSTDDSFLIVSIFAGLALSLLFYSYLSLTEVQPSIAALTTVLFLLNKYFYGFPVWNYFQIDDILSNIEIVLLMWTMVSRKWLWFGFTLLLGSITRETPLLFIPIAFVFALEGKLSARTWRRISLAFIPAIVIWLALRFLLHPIHGNNLLQALHAYSNKLILPETWFRVLINSLIPFSLIPLVFSKTTIRYFRSRRYAICYVLLVVVSTFFGFNNERLMAPIFIVFFSLIAIIIQEHIIKSNTLTIVFILSAVVGNLHHTYARFPIPREWSVGLALIAFAGVTLTSLLYKIRIADRQGDQIGTAA